MENDHKPRITIDIKLEQEENLKKYIPHGMKKRIFGYVIDDMNEIMSDPQRRVIFLGAMAARDLKLEDWLKVPKTTFRRLEKQLQED